MVEQALAGFAYKHYFAREIYYTGTQNGHHVVVYLSDEVPVLNSATNIWVGSGLRVDCYTNMTTNLGAARLAVTNYGGGYISWGVQDFVLSDCQPTVMGGVRYDLPGAVSVQNNRANMAAASSNFASMLLFCSALLVLYCNLFRRR
jgi:hypothetical protein